MTSGRLHVTSRSTSRFVLVAAVAFAGGAAYLARTRRPHPVQPAAAPPRIGRVRSGSVSAAGTGTEHEH
ncbi:hypothetical protein [Nocardia sp. CNY236]|uniref:hypothetical protein n=1 Tax=Nocardia sp. CNY236 TaxID=1169152 RepID=UPI00048E1E5A|nr:hypothetical protein [Nocardia sp. CNY236]